MNTLSKAPTNTCCPACGTPLSFQPHPPPFDAPCPDCGYSLWCCTESAGDVLILKVIPGMTPEHAEVEQLCDAIVAARSTPHVVVDLCEIEFIGSALTARLIAFNKRIRAVGGRFVLCGLCPFVRDTFHGSRLDRVFEVADDEQAA